VHSVDFFERQGLFCIREFLDSRTRAGDFYEPDRDGARDRRLPMSGRRVSVVVFLNPMREGRGPDEYSGGALTRRFTLVDRFTA